MGKAKKFGRGGKGMLSHMQQLQDQLTQAQADLADKTVEASAGGGAVRIVMSGTQECKAVEIAPDLLNEVDVDMLQDLILAAINQAIRDSQIMAADQLGSLTGGLGIT